MKSLLILAFLSLGVVSLSQNVQAAETPSQPTVNQKGSELRCHLGFHASCSWWYGGREPKWICRCVPN